VFLAKKTIVPNPREGPRPYKKAGTQALLLGTDSSDLRVMLHEQGSRTNRLKGVAVFGKKALKEEK
jgi:hypothetical protein